MRGIREPVPTRVRVSALRLGLLGLVAVTISGSLYLSRHRYGQFVMAARPGLDGPDIDLLERENKGDERIIQATTPAIVYIRTEQVVKAEQSPLFMRSEHHKSELQSPDQLVCPLLPEKQKTSVLC